MHTVNLQNCSDPQKPLILDAVRLYFTPIWTEGEETHAEEPGRANQVTLAQWRWESDGSCIKLYMAMREFSIKGVDIISLGHQRCMYSNNTEQ